MVLLSVRPGATRDSLRLVGCDVPEPAGDPDRVDVLALVLPEMGDVLVQRPFGVERFGLADNLPAGEFRTLAHTRPIGIVVPFLKSPEQQAVERPSVGRSFNACNLFLEFCYAHWAWGNGASSPIMPVL